MIFAGPPTRLLRNRWTSFLPNDPVPPIIRIFLPSKHFIFDRPPFFIRSVIVRELRYQFVPRWADVAGRSLEFVSAETPVAKKLVVRKDLDVQFIRLAK